MRVFLCFSIALSISACSSRGDGNPRDAGPRPDVGPGVDTGPMPGVDAFFPPPEPTIVIGPGAPPDAAMRFDGPTGGAAPELVYPNDGTMVPPNLNELEFHFRPGPGNTLFEIRFLGRRVDLRVYVGCTTLGEGCMYTPDEDTWRLLSMSEAGLANVTWSIRGIAGTAGDAVGASASRELGFAEEDMVGGLYYWNAAAGAVRRYDFGLRRRSAENYMDAARAGAMTCVGCHVLSRNGERIAVGMDIPAPAPYAVFRTGTRELYYRQGSASPFGGSGANFFSFSPDSTQILTSNGIDTVLRNADTGGAITDPFISNGTMPDWSPDGNRVVFARPAMSACPPGFPCGGVPGIGSASLETMNLSGGTWAPGPTLVPFMGGNNYYPSWSPEGGWVIFNRSPSNQNSFDAPDAQVWAVNADGSRVVQLLNASNARDSWPKWAPTIYMNRGRSLFWFTFSSRRPVGLRPQDCSGEGGCGPAQIWMAAFDPAAGADGDPSLPAFWLPFQEPESGNHIAQWVLTVDRQPCGATPCPGGEFCQDGYCVPDLI